MSTENTRRAEFLEKMRPEFERLMRELHFVMWDRYSGDEDCISVYGWIDRDDDYKDFCILGMTSDVGVYYDTSSAAYSLKIHRIIFGEDLDADHQNCERVEDYFTNMPNIIKIKK